MDNCPCGSGLSYTNCCEPLIKGQRTAQTAEALMRSRYSAYVKAEVEYIIQTTHPTRRKPDDAASVRKWSENADWHALRILECQKGDTGDDEGSVEFIAEYSEKGAKQQHHEIAEFKKRNGDWFFFDGRAPAPKQVIRSGPKVGRNDPCPCGSGKKFKKCCGS